jgi:hypothetical protein
LACYKNKKNFPFSPCDWEEVLYSLAARLRQTHPDEIAGISGALVRILCFLI